MNKVEKFLEEVKIKNPNEPEFIQAVEEVVENVYPFLEENPKYLDKKILERMMEPERTIIFKVPWMDDAGEVQINRGFRVQMNSAIGPYKGGLRFHPSVNLSILKFLAFEQVFKNSLTTLPMGGGKGGADFDPKGKSDNEVMRFCQSFMIELSRHIGANLDVPAGDIGVGAREIGYLFGQYKRLRNEFTGTLTGKNLFQGGSLVRTEATGYGLVFFMENMLKTKKDDLVEKKCLVSGSGNVAQYAVELLIKKGAKVLTMSDSSGTIYDKNGIDEEKLAFIMELKNVRHGRLKEYAEKYACQYLEGKNPWNINGELAFPCATQNEISKIDAENLIKNGIIAVGEGANMPTSKEAVNVFLKAKILFSPGKASNAGGVAVSGLEMTQNSLRLSWTREDVLGRLENIMKSIHKTCVKYGEEDDFVNYVRGANIG
ncbi:MAG: NADP-specific glutamate dehydrogenase, partial [Candidatus Cloacimonadota bacterium]|nr:NADP-specific glutamate dehydrogenase [Candidatus Cloacimonadota bacterium]